MTTSARCIQVQEGQSWKLEKSLLQQFSMQKNILLIMLIPLKTTVFRISKKDNSAPTHMEPSSIFGQEIEEQIVKHKSYAKKWISNDTKRLAYNFALIKVVFKT